MVEGDPSIIHPCTGKRKHGSTQEMLEAHPRYRLCISRKIILKSTRSTYHGAKRQGQAMLRLWDNMLVNVKIAEFPAALLPTELPEGAR